MSSLAILSEVKFSSLLLFGALKLIKVQLFQAKWCMPGADPDVRRIPTTIIAKALAWQRNRSRNSKDVYFDEFVEEFLHGMGKEMPELKDGKQTPTFPADNHTVDETEGWISVCCFRLSTRIISRLTAKSLLGRPACRDPELIDLFYRYGNTVPPDGFFLSSLPSPLKP